MITRDELIEHLKELPEDITFLVSSDQEGNSFRNANVGDVEMAYQEGYEWQTVHEDDLEEYEDIELKKVVVFW